MAICLDSISLSDYSIVSPDDEFHSETEVEVIFIPHCNAIYTMKSFKFVYFSFHSGSIVQREVDRKSTSVIECYHNVFKTLTTEIYWC